MVGFSSITHRLSSKRTGKDYSRFAGFVVDDKTRRRGGVQGAASVEGGSLEEAVANVTDAPVVAAAAATSEDVGRSGGEAVRFTQTPLPPPDAAGEAGAEPSQPVPTNNLPAQAAEQEQAVRSLQSRSLQV